MTSTNDFCGILLVLRLARKGEDILGFAIGELVDPEPLVGRSDQTRELSLKILDII